MDSGYASDIFLGLIAIPTLPSCVRIDVLQRNEWRMYVVDKRDLRQFLVALEDFFGPERIPESVPGIHVTRRPDEFFLERFDGLLPTMTTTFSIENMDGECASFVFEESSGVAFKKEMEKLSMSYFAQDRTYEDPRHLGIFSSCASYLL